MSFFNGISMWTSVIFGVEKLKQLFSCKEEIILWAMDAICSFTQHVTLNYIIRRVICILVILSLGNSIQVSEFYSNLWHNFYFSRGWWWQVTIYCIITILWTTSPSSSSSPLRNFKICKNWLSMEMIKIVQRVIK